jgi:hypothetical protein
MSVIRKPTPKERIERRDHVQKFIPPEGQEITRAKDIIYNYMRNEFPYPVTMREIFSNLKADGFEFSIGAFKMQLYRLRDEKKVERVRTPKGRYWIVREANNIKR